jgi:hypothetical protein
MKLALTILGVLLIIAGLIWIGQGIGIIPGSFMTGDIKWAIIGAGCVVAGGLFLHFGYRKAK